MMKTHQPSEIQKKSAFAFGLSVPLGMFLVFGWMSIAESHSKQSGKSARAPIVRTFETQAQGKIHVVIRSDGHVLAKPYIVEVRPQCKSKKTNWKELPVVDMESACKVEVESLQISVERGEITIQIHDTDAEDYRRKSFRSPGKVVPVCSPQAKTFSIPLASLCEK
jgi:hypothetical protein